MDYKNIEINIIRNNNDWKDLLNLPWSVYKGNQNWVPPLLSEVKEILDVKRNPFWEHAQRELFLARRNGKVVGRIAAIIDDNHNSFHQEQTGFFGFFECVEDFEAAKALWIAAKNWLKERKMQIMRGPVNPSMNDECAFLLEGFDRPSVIMMPYTQPYYLKLAEQYGLRKAKDLYAFIKNKEDGIPERIERMVEIVKKKTGVKIRSFDTNNFEKDVQNIKDIYNSAWEKNWGFVPMTDREIDLMAIKLKQFFEPKLTLFAEIDNKPVGVVLTVPDMNQVLIKLNGKLGLIGILKYFYYKRKITGARSLVAGIKKEYRNSGIIAVLFYETLRTAIQLGYEWGEIGWNLEDNYLINQFDSDIGGKIYKKYRIYEMKIN